MFQPSVMPAGNNIVLKSFVSEGIHRHSNSIENYYPLLYRGTLAANDKVFFEITRHLQLLSIIIVSDEIIESGDPIVFSIKNIQDNITYPFTIMAPANILLTEPEQENRIFVGVLVDFPFLVISPDWNLEISININIKYLNLWTKEVFVEPAILGQRKQ